MRLKNIKLAGFKSFVDPTNVKLTSNMVAVVGPNGCGKSNIIDAVRWVMGESSAKNLRGESMADVIFNGSTARKPVGQASIELIFDNSEGTLGGEYGAFGEISVKRQVTRDGQSQYFINAAKCRRRDITDIFLGTGLGPRSYAIIEQGMISRLIESKPEELRVFIEEAAGISKYKERRRETETRIRHTRENLERLTDLREELERQLQRLKRQSAAAEKYKQFKAEEKIVKAQSQGLQWTALRDSSKDQREEIARLEIELEASVAEQRGIDAKIEELREQHIEKTDRFNEVNAEYYGLGSEIARVEQTITHHEQRAQQLVDDLAETERNAAESSSHLQEDRQKLEQWETELAEISPRQQALAESESASSAALQQAEEAMQDWQQRWDSFNESAAEPQKNAEVQRSRIDQIEGALKGLSARLQRLNDELGSLDTEPLEKDRSALQKLAEEGEAALTSLQQQISDCSNALGAHRDQHKAISARLDSARSELQQQRGRYASLDALQAAAQADVEGDTSEWLKVHSLDGAPRLLDQLDVEPGWENAIEAVLGDSLQAIAVESLDSVISSLSAVGEHNISFVETGGNSGAAGKPGLVPLASKLAGGRAGDLLESIYACEDLNSALAARRQLAAHESLVTRDGIWLGAGWVRVVRHRDVRAGILQRRKEVEALEQEIIASETLIAGLESELAGAEQSVSQGEQKKDQLLTEKSNCEQQLSEQRAEISALEARIDQVSTRIQRTGEEISHAEHNQGEQRDALAEAREKLQTALDSMELVAGQRQELLLERDKVRDELGESRETAQTQRDALQEVAMRSEALRAQAESMRNTISRLENQVEQLNQRKQTLLQTQQENQQPMEGLRQGLAEQLENRMTVEAKLSDARSEVEALDQTMRESDQSRTAAEQRTETIRSSLEKLRIDSQSSEVRLKTIEEQLVEEGFQLAAVLAEMPEEAELQLWLDKLADISKRIERLGAINLAAIEEYETESERKKYLDAQNDELESALATLESAIQKIDRETRSLFKETFDTLNESLKDLFPRVFGGGSAYLEMTGEDLLDTGIAIMARPPGKRNSTIHLLSGGEKALTAIALVFSIFQLNPAPFCMLDEVDAPLDDANTARYARMVKEMSDKVQFIFITHNKITMEMADHLMGVTMHEPGCSRLVSVDIDEAVELAAS